MSTTFLRNFRQIYGGKDWIKTIDKDICPLIEYLNTLPGLATHCSCSGHGCESYVSFYCKNPITLALIIAATNKLKHRKEMHYLRMDARLVPVWVLRFVNSKEMKRFGIALKRHRRFVIHHKEEFLVLEDNYKGRTR